jgi:hypothetical protein
MIAVARAYRAAEPRRRYRIAPIALRRLAPTLTGRHTWRHQVSIANASIRRAATN